MVSFFKNNAKQADKTFRKQNLKKYLNPLSLKTTKKILEINISREIPSK